MLRENLPIQVKPTADLISYIHLSAAIRMSDAVIRRVFCKTTVKFPSAYLRQSCVITNYVTRTVNRLNAQKIVRNNY
jgi:hypothetical protein